MSTKVEHAKQLGVRMSAAADALNDALRQAEEQIAALGLGVTASVSLGQDPDGWERHLEFGKTDGRWGLFLLSGPPNQLERSPLCSVSRAYRVRAADALPALLTQLINVASSEVTKVEKALEYVNLFNETIPKE